MTTDEAIAVVRARINYAVATERRIYGAGFDEALDALTFIERQIEALEHKLALCKQDEYDALQSEIGLQEQLETQQQHIEMLEEYATERHQMVDAIRDYWFQQENMSAADAIRRLLQQASSSTVKDVVCPSCRALGGENL